MTDDGGLTRLTLTDAGAALAAGEVSALELTEAYLARINAIDPSLNAYTTVTPQRARIDAERADAERRAGVDRGPLHGIPLGLKDLCDTAGIRTTSGSARRRDHVPGRDSAVAARLREAGAVLLGKHATHELAWGATCNNPHFGPTRNPYARDRIPGGSSGGSAASVVARTALASVGTDTAGSIRIPAALSGCVGIKPTYGRVSLAGVTPLAPSLDHAGPLARTVRDAATLLEVLLGSDAGPVAADSGLAAAGGLVAAANRPADGLRVARLRGWFEALLDAEVGAALDGTVASLRAQGATVVDVEVPDPGPLLDAVFEVVLAEAGPSYRADFAAHPDGYGDAIARQLRRTPPSDAEVAADRALMGRFAEQLCGLLEDADALLCATVAAPAPPIGLDHVTVAGQTLHVERLLTRLTSPLNAARLPTVSVPVGLSSAGLPIGAQVVARADDEATAITVAAAVETRLPEPPLDQEAA